MIEGVEAGGGEVASLAHPSADDLSVAAGAGDQVRRPEQETANGRTEAFAQADADGIEEAAPFSGAFFCFYQGVEQAGTVEVHG